MQGYQMYKQSLIKYLQGNLIQPGSRSLSNYCLIQEGTFFIFSCFVFSLRILWIVKGVTVQVSLK